MSGSTAPLLKILIDVRRLNCFELSQRLGYSPAAISASCRYPDTAGPRLRRLFEHFFDLSWQQLSTPCDRDQAAQVLLQNFQRN